MIKHLLRLVWYRRWVNLRIMIQILLSFLVVFAVVVWATYYYNNYRQPLGFNYHNVLSISATPGPISFPPKFKDKEDHLKNIKKYYQLLTAMEEFNEVEATGIIIRPPYQFWGITLDIDVPWKGRTIHFSMNYATEGIKDVLNLNIVNGRWFKRGDEEAEKYIPIVLNLMQAQTMFGDEDPIGKIIPTKTSAYRVIGVMEDCRIQGELSEPVGYVFHPFMANMGTGNILVRVRPGTTAIFEEKVLDRLKSDAKEWFFDSAEWLSDKRENINRPILVPLVIGWLIAGFLLIMVGLGLTGVLWLNVTQRTREIGLRRAKGATKGNIYRQIIGELSIVYVLGIVMGILIIIQLFPMVEFYNVISMKVYIWSIVISMVFVYALSILCGLYPGRLAAIVNPVEALHYE